MEKMFKTDARLFFVSDEGKLFDEFHNEITPYINNRGYAFYIFRINNKKRTILIHRLVYELFRGYTPQGMHVHHRDKNPLK